jgi:hypothetical protein
MKILITGCRDWKDYDMILSSLEKAIHENGVIFPNVYIVHGAARGADTIGALAALQLGIPKNNIKAYEADWKNKGRAAGPIRNSLMLSANPDIDLVLAFHDFLPNSKGTKDMVEKAKRKGIKVTVIGHER